MAFQTSDTLKSRSFIGLLSSQFLAAFNDHATQIVAIFYASDMLVRFVGINGIDEKLIVAIVTACFITPFFLFSPLAGIMADKYSKRNIIVFWKLAEVAIMAIALFGFLLPHFQSSEAGNAETLASWSAWLLVLTVFLMGTHSAFFVPAKFGVMPEILSPSILSRGNGFLEGTSFVAQILGTAFGGFLYGTYKSKFGHGTLEPGGEWIIGSILFGLALIGAVASFLIVKMPAAAPHRQLVWNPLVPLATSFAILKKSKPLILATGGIAFFLFMTLLLRQTLIFEGEATKELTYAQKLFDSTASVVETENPDDTLSSIPQAEGTPKISATQEAEFRIAMLVALVGLGVGIGCSLAGYFSGSRLELGLVPLGASLLIVLTGALAWAIGSGPGLSTQVCLVLIGISAGLYIVPMYTLLQHRAPKEAKGSLVALSNFLNVAGGLVAVVLFYFVTFALQKILGLNLSIREVEKAPELQDQLIEQLTLQLTIPQFLFVFASLMTVGMLIVLLVQRPDFISRAFTWISTIGRKHLRAAGMGNVPGDQPLVFVANSHDATDILDVLAVTDRPIRFYGPAGSVTYRGTFAEKLATSTGMIQLAKDAGDTDRVLGLAKDQIAAEHAVGVSISDGTNPDSMKFLHDLYQQNPSIKVLPVQVEKRHNKTYVMVGEPLPEGSSLEKISSAIDELEFSNALVIHHAGAMH